MPRAANTPRSASYPRAPESDPWAPKPAPGGRTTFTGSVDEIFRKEFSMETPRLEELHKGLPQWGSEKDPGSPGGCSRGYVNDVRYGCHLWPASVWITLSFARERHARLCFGRRSDDPAPKFAIEGPGANRRPASEPREPAPQNNSGTEKQTSAMSRAAICPPARQPHSSLVVIQCSVACSAAA